MIVQPHSAWMAFDYGFFVATFLGAGLGWWILSTSEIADFLLGKTVCRLVGGAWVAVGLAALAPLAMSVSLIALNACLEDDVSWWIYYGIGCWLP